MKTVRNGRHIDTYIPRELRRMFYRNPNPSAKYASRNGLDPYGFSTNGLVLYIPFWAMKDSAFKSVDAFKHTCTGTGTTLFWTPTGWDFGGVDEIFSGISFALPGDSSFDFWVQPDFADDEGANKGFLQWVIDAQNKINIFYNAVGGIRFYFESDNVLDGAVENDLSWSADDWLHLGASFDVVDGNALSYSDGLLTETGDAIANAMVGGAGTLTIGREASYGGYFNGVWGELLVYNRLLSAGEFLQNHNCTAWRYQ